MHLLYINHHGYLCLRRFKKKKKKQRANCRSRRSNSLCMIIVLESFHVDYGLSQALTIIACLFANLHYGRRIRSNQTHITYTNARLNSPHARTRCSCLAFNRAGLIASRLKIQTTDFLPKKQQNKYIRQ